ncbi:hypothetical protein [Paenibacillus nasutitermitis]|uniref:Uncharacterized protein n=1 Tax=Paenibacillus nasutitermitis TaxID=1652958 RepID=A0A917DS24_9BACL|nr:hypothetical protein [Paenibacillus nasutitermitis]GGD65575.1 hypothetical protein GCM10010911_24210 [Paenibacillus nasutitermitis]
MNNQPAEKKKTAKPFRWKRLAVAAGIFLLILLGGVYYAYDRMTDHLLEVLMDDAMASDGWAGEAPGTASDNSLPSLSADSDEAGEKMSLTPKKQPAQSGGDSAEALSTSYDAVITADKASQVKENVTMKEKLAIGSVILRHFSSDELSSFKKAASGGLTREEKKELKEQAMSKLSAEEYDELIAIAKKYGLSKGKSYQDSLEE